MGVVFIAKTTCFGPFTGPSSGLKLCLGGDYTVYRIQRDLVGSVTIDNIGITYSTVLPCTIILSNTTGMSQLKRLLASSCLSVRPSIHIYQLGSHRTDFHVTWCLSIFREVVEKIQALIKSDKNNGYFTWWPLDIFIISRSVFLRMRNVSEKICGTQSACFVFSNLFRRSCCLRDNVEKYCRRGRTRMKTLRMQCYTHTHNM